MDATKLSDSQFEITEPSTTQYDVTAVLQEIAGHQDDINRLVGYLQGAAAAGCANAQPAIDQVVAQPLSTVVSKTSALSVALAS